MNIALIRHGVTPSNIKNAFLGGKTDEGLHESAVKALSSHTYPEIDILISSPLRRCLETAEIIYPGRAPLIYSELCEMDFGDFEGMTHGEIIKQKGYDNWGMDAGTMIFPNGETFENFKLRCLTGFRKAIEHIGLEKKENVGIVTHGGVIMALMSEIILPRIAYYKWHCNNGEGYLLEYSGNIFNLKGRLFG